MRKPRKSIGIDPDVYNFIQKNGRYKETMSDILRRLLKMDKNKGVQK